MLKVVEMGLSGANHGKGAGGQRARRKQTAKCSFQLLLPGRVHGELLLAKSKQTQVAGFHSSWTDWLTCSCTH